MRLVEEKNKTVYVPDDADGAYIEIRNLSLEVTESIDSKFYVINENGLELSDYIARDNALARASLVGWGNFFDVNGKQLKFTPKNIEKASALSLLMDGKKVRFFEWVNK